MIQAIGVLDRVINDLRTNALQEPSHYLGQVAAEYVNRVDQDPCITVDWYWCWDAQLLKLEFNLVALTMFPHFRLVLARNVQRDHAN